MIPTNTKCTCCFIIIFVTVISHHEVSWLKLKQMFGTDSRSHEAQCKIVSVRCLRQTSIAYMYSGKISYLVWLVIMHQVYIFPMKGEVTDSVPFTFVRGWVAGSISICISIHTCICTLLFSLLNQDWFCGIQLVKFHKTLMKQCLNEYINIYIITYIWVYQIKQMNFINLHLSWRKREHWLISQISRIIWFLYVRRIKSKIFSQNMSKFNSLGANKASQRRMKMKPSAGKNSEL